MKIVHLITHSTYGGAGIACKRISDSINVICPNSSIVIGKDSFDTGLLFPGIKSMNSGLSQLNFLSELIYNKFIGVEKRFQFGYSPAKFGRYLERWQQIQEADIINLHWINHGFLSLKSLEKLAELGKPVVWTMHDMWAFTGGCHYSNTCHNFKRECGQCFMISNSKLNDNSFYQNIQKSKIYKKLKPTFISPSNWLHHSAKSSQLLNSFPVHVIPNPIDIEVFKPDNRENIRKKYNWGKDEFVIIMNAFKINKPIKGFTYLKSALMSSIFQNSEIKGKIRLVLIGENKDFNINEFPFPVEIFGYIKEVEKIIEINQGADVYVSPSLEENLPNTIMEALACGLPTVAFNIGGIPDLVDHKINGYLADPKSADDLANGIIWVFNSLKNSNILKIESRNKVLNNFTYSKVGKEYMKIYKNLL